MNGGAQEVDGSGDRGGTGTGTGVETRRLTPEGVWGTRSSILDWALVAGLSCTERV